MAGQFLVDWGNFVLGQGYNSLTLTGQGVALDGIPDAPSISPGTGVETTLDFQVIEDSAKLAAALDVSASLAVDAGEFAGSAKANFVKNNVSDGNSVYCLVRCTVKLPPAQLTSATRGALTLKAALASEFSSAAGQIKFRENYGDSFVCGWERGGEFYALLKTVTNSKSDKQSLTAEITGKYDAGAMSIKGSASVAASIEKLASSRHVDCHVFKSGGGVLGELKTFSIEELLGELNKFEAQVVSAPMNYKAIMLPYSSIVDLQRFDFSLLDKAEFNLKSLGEIRLDLLSLQQQVAFVIANKEQFLHDSVNDDALEQAKANTNKVISILDKYYVDMKSALETEMLTADELKVKLGIDQNIEQIQKSLPERIDSVPRCANDLPAIFGQNLKDGNYKLFVDERNVTRCCTFYCSFHNNVPKSFLELPSVDNNYSVWPVSHKSSDGQDFRRGSSNITTKFRRVAVRIESSIGALVVDLTDVTFADTTGGPISDYGASGKLVGTITHADFATASASNYDRNDSNPTHTPWSETRVDFSGTDWQIDDAVTTWQPFGWRPHGTEKSVGDRTRERHFAGGGAPGGYAPRPALQLKYAGAK